MPTTTQPTPDLLPRLIDYLRRADDWVDERTLLRKAQLAGFSRTEAEMALVRLQGISHIGYLRWKFCWYSPHEGDGFMQAAIDEFDSD